MKKLFADGLVKLTKHASSLPSATTRVAKDGTALNVLKNLDKVPVNVSDGVRSVITEITDYLKVAQIETTKRVEITAKRDIALQSLQNQRAVFEQLMQYTFQERAAVINKQFEVLDHAMLNGDVSTIKNALDGMVSVIQTSPFKSIQEMQTALGSKDFVVRLE